MNSSSNKNKRVTKLLQALVFLFCLGFNEAFSQDLQKKLSLQELMIPAIKAYREKKYEEAYKWIEQALQQMPNDPSLARLRNEIVLKISTQSKASGDLKKAKLYATKVLGIPGGGLSLEAQTILSGMDQRPKKGLHGYISSAFEYNTNVASSVDPGNTRPTNKAGYGSRSGILLGYRGHVSDDYYWDVWGEALPLFWKGPAKDLHLDWQQYNTGLLVARASDRWNLSLAYKFSADVFGSDLNRVRHGPEATAKYWVIPSHWQTWLSASVFFDDFKVTNNIKPINNADATYVETSLQNYIPFYLEVSNAYGYLFGGYTYIDNNASSIYSYKSHRVSLAFFIPTPFWSVGIQTGGMLERRSYDQPYKTTLNPTDRRDTIGIAYAELIKEWKLPEMMVIKGLSDSIQTKLGYTYIETQSSVKAFDKVEHVGRFTVMYQF